MACINKKGARQKNRAPEKTKERQQMIQKTAIIGMGALGTLYGDMIMRSKGRDAVEFIVDDERYERYKNKTTTVLGKPVDFKTVRAGDATVADLVIVAVKLRGLQDALDSIKNCIGEKTAIISVMNGISSEKMIAERYGSDRVLYTVAISMDAMKLGDDLTYSKAGILQIGIVSNAQKPYLDAVCEFFESAGVPHTVEDDILHRLWSKFMLNVGVNQATAAFGADNETLLANQEIFDMFMGAMRETKALANAEGIALTESDMERALNVIKSLDPKAYPSTAQDVVAKRPTEVDLFGGTVVEMSKRHGLETPFNEELYRRIKQLEAEY